jgi:hypothetical protein
LSRSPRRSMPSRCRPWPQNCCGRCRPGKSPGSADCRMKARGGHNEMPSDIR